MNKTIKIILLWVILAVLAILNGTVREFGYKPLVGDYLAHVISTVSYVLVMFGVMYFFFRKILVVDDARALLKIGLQLLLATIIFEFVFGHYVIGHPWEKLFADYNILQGRVWGLVLIAILFGPRIVGRNPVS
ncbi:hypothetical protein IPM65_00355 [Candidatus Roizmanbacteria bacterium]|nr:MAG: hypothetical protein IPM65_00355 [Candidatus Roizmanbacteria bacterium]